MATIKIINRYLITFLFISGCLLVKGQDIPDNYLIEAAKNNPGLKSKFNEYMSALEQVAQSGSLPDPQLTFGYFIQPVETRVGPQKARISVTQMFPWFGTTGAKKDAVSENAKAKYELFEEAKSKIFYDVKSVWYNLYFTRKEADITAKNIDILNTLRSMALIKVEAGMTSSVDVLRAEMEIADLQNQLLILRDNIQVIQSEFNNLLNVNDMRPVNIPDTLKNPDLQLAREAIMDSIRSNNHQVLQIGFMENIYAKQEEVARKTGKPNLAVGFDYIFVGQSSNTALSASESGRDALVFPMVGLSVPLYRKKYASAVREAELMRESSANNKLDKINILATSFAKAERDYNDSGRRILLFRDQIVKAGKSLNILTTEYETDGKNFEDVLSMERRLLKYRMELEKARADKDAAVAFINYLMGK